MKSAQPKPQLEALPGLRTSSKPRMPNRSCHATNAYVLVGDQVRVSVQRAVAHRVVKM